MVDTYAADSGVERQKGRSDAVAVEERWSAPAAGEREAYGIAISTCLSRAQLAPRGRPPPSLMSSPAEAGLVMCFASLAPFSLAQAAFIARFVSLCVAVCLALERRQACRLPARRRE